MIISQFQGCCSAIIIHHLHELNSYYGDKEHLIYIKSRILALLRDWNNMKVLVAITSDEQKGAEKALKELGFAGSRRYYNHHHWHVFEKIKLWHISIPKLLE